MEPAAAIENVEDWADCYFFLVGMLGSENNGERSFSSWYGFTEIAPGQVTTDIIRDADGKLVIDLSQATIIAKDGAQIEGNLSIGSGSSGLDNLTEWTDKTKFIITEKLALRDELLKIMDIKGEPGCSIGSSIIREADGTLEISRSNSSWKEVKSGDTNNGNPQDNYIGWIKSCAISSNGTTINIITIFNPNDSDRFVSMEFISDGESNYDYLMVGVLDQAETPTAGTTSSYDFETKGKQKTIISKSYIITPGQHTLKLVYRKDGSVNTGTDSAYYRITSICKDVQVIDIDFANLSSGSLRNTLEMLDGKLFSKFGAIAQNLIVKAQVLAGYSISNFDVWTDITTAVTIDNRNSLANMLKEYHQAEYSVTGKVMDSDFGYLAETFGDSLDVDGVVLSRLVGVKDRLGYVVAGLNGSEMGKDNDHGKMLFFGGTARATDAELKNADTKIYEDGTIDTSKLIVHDGARIGDFIIQGLSLKSNSDGNYGGTYSIRITKGGISILSDNFKYEATKATVSNNISLCSFLPLSTGGHFNNPVSISSVCSQADDVSNMDKMTNTALIISATGAKPIATYLGSPIGGNFAIQANNGMFAGLRPMTRYIGSNQTLTKLDHTILTWKESGTLTITLPTNPENGQEYIFYKMKNYSLVVTAPNNVIINNIHGVKGQSTGENSSFAGVVSIVWSSEDNCWWYARFN